MVQADVFNDIIHERRRQKEDLGYTEFHDDHHTNQEWRSFIHKRLGVVNSLPEFRENMVQIAAIAVAAIEASDRKLRSGGG